MTVEILPRAKEDIVAAYRFYEQQEKGIGDYFRETIFSSVEALRIAGGIHAVVYGYHRKIARPFPFVIYYRLTGELIQVHAILDCRGDPNSIERTLHAR